MANNIFARKGDGTELSRTDDGIVTYTQPIGHDDCVMIVGTRDEVAAELRKRGVKVRSEIPGYPTTINVCTRRGKGYWKTFGHPHADGDWVQTRDPQYMTMKTTTRDTWEPDPLSWAFEILSR